MPWAFGDWKTLFFSLKLKCWMPFALTTALSQWSNLKFRVDEFNVDLSYYMNSDFFFLFLFLFHFSILFSDCVPFSWS